MLKSLKLGGVGPVPELAATFGSRLNLLTGDNGLGKSFLLDVCFWALTGTWPGGRTALPPSNGKGPSQARISYAIEGKSSDRKSPGKDSDFDFRSQTWNRPKGRPVLPGLVVYAAVDGSFAVWDPARNYRRSPESGIRLGDEPPKAYQFSAETLANGLREGDRLLCKGLVDDWVTWYLEANAESSGSLAGDMPESPEAAFRLLESVTESLSHPLEPMSCGEPRRIYVDDPRKFPVLEMPYGSVAYPHWSAGVRRIIGFAYLLVWTWHEHLQASLLRKESPTNRIVLLVDEIEAHLHPKWQRSILPSLLPVLKKLGNGIEIQVFAATHSPLVLASLETHFDSETDKLFRFDLQGSKIDFREAPWILHGDVVGWLTSDLFGLSQARSREAEAAIDAAQKFMRGEFDTLPTGMRTQAEIHGTLKQTLPGLDPFWPRWIVSTEP